MTLLFIPVIALRAHRVGDAPEGWFFFGIVPLSAFAKLWNLVLVLALCVVGPWYGWDQYTQTDGYQEKAKLADAERLLAENNVKESVALLHEVAQSRTSSRWGAQTSLRKVAAERLFDIPLVDAVTVLETVIRVEESAGKLGEKQRELYDRAVALAKVNGDRDPQGALQVLGTVSKLATDGESFDKLREGLLEEALRRNDQRDDQRDDQTGALASELALLIEKRGDDARCQSLLEPHAGKLGSTEGARTSDRSTLGASGSTRLCDC